MLTGRLTKAGYRCTVATSGSEPLAATFQAQGVEVFSLTRRTIKHRLSPTFITRLAWRACHGDFDLIHAHLHSASIAAAVAARVSGLPLVLTHHSMNTWRPPWHCALGRWADRQADVVIAVAGNVAASIEPSGVPARIIPNGVPTPGRLWSDSRIAKVRTQLGIPPRSYVISYVGRFSGDKNPLLFIRSAAMLAPRCPNAHFLLLGDGSLRPAAERLALALGIHNRLTFAGFQPNAAELHQVADVLALTSDSEASPLVVLEAMAACRPVVATAVGDVPRQIVDGETGFLVPRGDAVALANALARLQDDRLRERLSRAARKRVLQHFLLDHTVAMTAAVYRELGAQPSPHLLANTKWGRVNQEAAG